MDAYKFRMKNANNVYFMLINYIIGYNSVISFILIVN